MATRVYWRGWDRTGDLPRLKSAQSEASQVNRNSRRPAVTGRFMRRTGLPVIRDGTGQHGLAPGSVLAERVRDRFVERERAAARAGRLESLVRTGENYFREPLLFVLP